MKTEKIANLLKKRTKVISIKLNPELVKLLDEAIKEDGKFSSRNEFFEKCVLKYLEERGKL